MTRVLEAFAGLGGQALGWHRAGAEHVGFIERAPFCRRLLARHWPAVPVFDDVLTFDSAPYRGRVDVLSGGPPCQPVSSAGLRRGTSDDRWLWGAFVGLAVAVDAPMVVAENPPGLLSAQGGDAMYAVLCAFGDAGYSVEWDILAAGTLGAPHRRERVFLVARRDGCWTWRGRGQASLFPGRPAAWPQAGRWSRHTLTVCERRWPTPRPLPWESAADAEALPTPPATDAADRDWQDSRGVHYATLGGAAKVAAGVEPQPELRRALPTPQAHDAQGAPGATARARRGFMASLPARTALPTPTARDGKDGTAKSCAGVEVNALLGREVHTRAVLAGGRLSPALPEWMLGLPADWSQPDGPSLLDAPSRPYLPDLTAEVALTTEREHRRPRLRGLGNACQVEVAEAIARGVLASAREQHGE